MSTEAVSTEELLIALLTGGGLALLGTVLGALITQVFAARLERERRSEARLLAVRTFQRDTLVALQDDVVEADNLFQTAQGLWGSEEFAASWSAYESVSRRVVMHGTRVRDDYLRAAVTTWVQSRRGWLDDKESTGIVSAKTIRKTIYSVRAVHDRAGELIRTLDAIDDMSSPAPEPASTSAAPDSN